MDMNVRNDSAKVAEAHRQADLIANRVAGRTDMCPPPDTMARQEIANALLDIWQRDAVSGDEDAVDDDFPDDGLDEFHRRIVEI